MTVDEKALEAAHDAYAVARYPVNGVVPDVTYAIRAAIEAYQSSLSGDDLYVRVPREPTEEMLDAAVGASVEHLMIDDSHGAWMTLEGYKSVFRAMLAAAPASPAGGERPQAQGNLKYVRNDT